jgi:hypothetical protein
MNIDQQSMGFAEIRRLQAENRRLRRTVLVLLVAGTAVWMALFL